MKMLEKADELNALDIWGVMPLMILARALELKAQDIEDNSIVDEITVIAVEMQEKLEDMKTCIKRLELEE